jgi:excisionase family DNA binding protein
MSASKKICIAQAEWMDLKAIQAYACVSERTIREWIHLPVNPLRASQAGGGKILIKRSHFDAWLEAHPYQPINSIDVDQITDEIIDQFRKAA